MNPAPTLADGSLRGRAWCRARAAQVDAWLAALLAGAGAPGSGVALVAVGGYGRAELCPASDVDVLLLHEGRADIADLAEQVWYPVWDSGIKLGHQVCTPHQAIDLARDDLDTATALLDVRHVAGDVGLTGSLATEAAALWTRRANARLAELDTGVTQRHERVGDVAFSLEPDLKEGRGGLRDVHALRWAEAAQAVVDPLDAPRLAEAYDVILGARVELQRLTGRPTNVLTLEDQDAVAAALGDRDADACMGRLAAAARVIAWVGDDAWRRIRRSLPRRRFSRAAGSAVPLGDGLVLREGEVHLAADAAASPLAIAAAAARSGAVIGRDTLRRLAGSGGPVPEPWPAGERARFVELLLSGRAAIPVVEGLDDCGVWGRLIPEWGPVRSRPQRNAYHRFTVDRHLLEAAANAADLADRVSRPDLLVVGALLHDLGKGTPGDHVERAAGLASQVAKRMGFDDAEVDTIAALAALHLLLPEVATSRDLDDPGTIERVAAAVGTPERLHLLAALTEADSQATSPVAWSAWKAELIDRLVRNTESMLAGPPEAAPVARVARPPAGGRRIEALGSQVTVVADDRPGTFSRVAGVLSLHGLDVIDAVAMPADDGRALSEFRVAADDEIRWDKVVADLHLALDGRLALSARLADRARTYRQRHRQLAEETTVRFDNEASAVATVVDVCAPDGVGVLYRITRALAEADLDIRSAKAETRGAQAYDAFYVCDARGEKLADPDLLAEIARAVMHSLVEQ
jgi:[protein-PII] uridylyltransferase